MIGDDDDEDVQKIIDKRQRKRFGAEVSTRRLKIGNCLRSVGIIIAILVIPIQMFLR